MTFTQEDFDKKDVKIKLEILFGLSSEEDIEEQFSIIKDKYINLKTLLKDIESYLLEDMAQLNIKLFLCLFFLGCGLQSIV